MRYTPSGQPPLVEYRHLEIADKDLIRSDGSCQIITDSVVVTRAYANTATEENLSKRQIKGEVLPLMPDPDMLERS